MGCSRRRPTSVVAPQDHPTIWNLIDRAQLADVLDGGGDIGGHCLGCDGKTRRVTIRASIALRSSEKTSTSLRRRALHQRIRELTRARSAQEDRRQRAPSGVSRAQAEQSCRIGKIVGSACAFPRNTTARVIASCADVPVTQCSMPTISMALFRCYLFPSSMGSEAL